jgi:hypothetical protein
VEEAFVVAGDKHLAVGRKGHKGKSLASARQGQHFLPRSRLPQLDRFTIVTPGGQAAGVG